MSAGRPVDTGDMPAHAIAVVFSQAGAVGTTEVHFQGRAYTLAELEKLGLVSIGMMERMALNGLQDRMLKLRGSLQ